MKKTHILSLLVSFIMLMAIPAFASENINNAAFTIGSKSAQGMDIQFVLPDYEIEQETISGNTYNKIKMQDTGYLTETGMPELPTLSTMIAIPNRGRAYVEVINAHTKMVDHIIPFPAQSDDSNTRNLTINSACYNGNQIYPQEVLRYSDPQILRDFRLITVQVQPFSWDSATNQLIVRDQITLRVRYTDEPGINEMEATRSISSSFDNIYNSLILNYRDYRTGLIANTPPKIVIVYGTYTDATFQTKLNNFALWKRQKGADVRVVSTSVAGNSSTAIKAYLQGLYNDPGTRPDFIAIVGDVNGSFAVPSWTTNGYGDYPYQMLAGNDQLGDVFIGRISAESTEQLDVIFSKIYAYEKTLNIPTAQWLDRMLLVADTQHDGISVVYQANYIRELSQLQNPDYTYTMLCQDGPAVTAMNAAISQGVGFFNYRGYIGMSGWNPSESLTNVNKLCHAVIITCSTGNFDGTGTTESFIRLGTAAAPKGAVTAIGMYSSGTHTMPNNSLSGGIFAGIFSENMRTMGEALLHSKLNFARLYAVTNPSMYASFSQWCNLMGDPTMEVYISIPNTFATDAPTSIPIGTNNMDVSVVDQDGLPVYNACVTVSGLIGADNVILSRTYTDASGMAYLPFTADVNAGNVILTISMHDYKPLQQTISVTSGSLVSGMILIDDDAVGNSVGNGNNQANSGETLEILFSLRNTTTDAINTVTGYVTCDSPYATVVDSLVNFDSLIAGGTQFNLAPILVQVAPGTPNNTLLRFSIHVTDASLNPYEIADVVSITDANLRLVSTMIIDGGNATLDPGETATLNVTLLNSGTVPVNNLLAELYSDNDLVVVNDSLGSFGTVNVNAQSTTNIDNFILHGRNLLLPGMVIPLRMKLTNSDGFMQWLSFNLTVGVVTVNDPMGPDAYGYVIYDDTDVSYTDCPVYDWVGIAPAEGGSGTALNINDPEAGGEGDGLGATSLATVTLPFTFTFYGQDYSQITVCSNGFLVMGTTTNAEFRNYRIPGAMGPGAMIAPFWDDLATGNGGGVYTWNDAANHRYIVEWYQMQNGYLNSQLETFQVILFDPAFYSTSLGDGPVKIQYNTFNNVDTGADVYNHGNYCTIGIENPAQNIGLEYSFSNSYPTAAAPMGNGRALYITNSPVYYENAYLVMGETIITDMNNGDNIVEPGESVELGVQLLNIGSNPANGINAVVSTVDPYVTITNDESAYYTITGDGSGVNQTAFTFEVSPTCPGNHSIPFTMDITTSNNTWQRTFSIAVQKSELQYESFFLNDIEGNNNGIADPGETFLLIVNVKNQSEVTALNAIGQLTTSNPNTSIPNSALTLNKIDSGDINQFVYQVNFNTTIQPNTYVPFTFSVMADNAALVSETVTVGCGTSGMNLDFEANNGNFSSSSGWVWGVPAQTTAHSGQKVWATGLSGEYPDNSNYSLTTPPITIGANATLSFWHKLGCENSYDGGNISVSTNGGSTWTVVSPASGGSYIQNIISMNEPGFSGAVGNWTQVTFNLGTYANNEIIIKWHFTSDTSVVGIGWFIDDVMITGFATRTGIISGEVLLSDNGNPSWAKVSSQGLFTSIPDSTGAYALYLPTGAFTLTASLPYYQSATSPNITITEQALVHDCDFTLIGLPAATGLTINGEPNQSTIGLSWIAPELPVYPVSAYKVYRKMGPGLFELLGQTNSTSYNDNLVLNGHYYYYVRALYSGGEGAPTDTVDIAFPIVPNGQEPTPVLVNALHPNYPNPFNPTTTLSYSISKAGNVSLKIFNTKGQLVKQLVNTSQKAGRYSVTWDGRDNDGKSAATGIYFYRITSGKYNCTRKMMMLK